MHFSGRLPIAKTKAPNRRDKNKSILTSVLSDLEDSPHLTQEEAGALGVGNLAKVSLFGGKAVSRFLVYQIGVQFSCPIH